MSKLDDLRAERKRIDAEIERLKRIQRKERYRKTIIKLRISLDDVERSHGDGKHWFKTVHVFSDWCSEHSNKKFMEWNTLVYRIEDWDLSNELCDIDSLKNPLLGMLALVEEASK